jgi:hypothetical protein
LIVGIVSSGAVILGVLLLWPKIGVKMFTKEEIHVTGFLIKSLKSNLVDFLSALDRPGAIRKMNPRRTIKAAIFLCIGASLKELGTPCRMRGGKTRNTKKRNHHSHPRRYLNLRD